MAYATRADLDNCVRQDELVRITDEGDLGQVDDAKVDAAIEAAGHEIDSYLGERYGLPFATVPQRLVALNIDLALWNLYSLADADGIPKARSERRQAAIDELMAYETGSKRLVGGDDGQSNASFSTGGRLFTRDSQRGLK